MSRRPFFKFDAEADMVWQKLYERQYPQVVKTAHSMYLDGLKVLDLPTDRVPDFERLNEKIYNLVGWELVSTDVQYSDGQEWFEALARKEFLITEYIRPLDSLDYTPLPDIWHDGFGHLPYLAHQAYVDYLLTFAQTALEFTPPERKGLGSIWWYSIEFGLMKENGVSKAFGAGLMSGYAELERAFNSTIPVKPFTMDEVTILPPSPHEYHDRMFLFESFDQLYEALEVWADHARKGERMGY